MALAQLPSNNVNLSFCEEASIGVLPTTRTWYTREPNSMGDFGVDLKSVPRAPITQSRQQSKGSIVDLDAAASWAEDFCPFNYTRLIQGMFFANMREKHDSSPLNEGSFPIVLSSASPAGFNAPANMGKFNVSELIYSSGWLSPQNNGVFVVTGTSATRVSVGGLANETANPKCRIQSCGFQFPAGDCSLVTGTTGKHLSTTTTDCTLLGLVPGEWIFVGDDDINNSFSNPNRGWARVSLVNATTIFFDEDTMTGTSGNGGTGKTIRIYFGKLIRNEQTASAQIRRTYTLERVLGDSGAGMQAEYIKGAVPNTLKLNIPTADKLTGEWSFVAKDAQYAVGTLEAGTRVAGSNEQAYNSSADIVRMRLYVPQTGVVIDPPSAVAYMSQADFTINNNVSASKAIGTLGAFEMTAGSFEVTGSITAYFSDIALISAIRANADFGINVIGFHGQQGFVFDMPLVSNGGGKLNIEKDKPIMIPITSTAVQNANGYTAQFNFFPYLPFVAAAIQF
jgi:hypothetical protein